MTSSTTAKVAAELLGLIAEGGDTTQRSLRLRLDESGFVLLDGFDSRRAVGQALKYMRGRGWAFKEDRPFNPRRSDLGHAWRLTDDGNRRLADRAERQAAREIEGFKQGG